MGFLRNRIFAAMAASLLAAAVFGSTLGIAVAGQQPLSAGVNPTVGGPLDGDVTPTKFMSCLPDGSWSSLYWWDALNQSWRHFFNTDGTNVPDYLNSEAAGGLTLVPRFSGVSLVMNVQVGAPFFPDRQSQSCP